MITKITMIQITNKLFKKTVVCNDKMSKNGKTKIVFLFWNSRKKIMNDLAHIYWNFSKIFVNFLNLNSVHSLSL